MDPSSHQQQQSPVPPTTPVAPPPQQQMMQQVHPPQFPASPATIERRVRKPLLVKDPKTKEEIKVEKAVVPPKKVAPPTPSPPQVAPEMPHPSPRVGPSSAAAAAGLLPSPAINPTATSIQSMPEVCLSASPSIATSDNVPFIEKLAVVKNALSEALAEFSQQKEKFDTDTKAKVDVQALAAQQEHIASERIAELERELNQRVAELERELRAVKEKKSCELSAVKAQKSRDMSANDKKTTALTRSISEAEQKMEQARATIAQCEKFQKEMEKVRQRLSHLLPAPAPPVAAPAPPVAAPAPPVAAPAPPVAAPPSPEDSNLCDICMENPKNHAFIKCGHQVCGVCADAVMQKNEKCPYCQQDIVDVLRLF